MGQVHSALRGLQRLTGVGASNVTLASLAGGDTATVDEIHKLLTHGFLAKRFRMWFSWIGDATEVEGLLLFLASGGINEAESEIALEDTGAGDPDDHSNYGRGIISNRVIHSTLFAVGQPFFKDAGTTEVQPGYTGWLTVGAKGKGIPYAQDFGPEIHAWNYSDVALTSAFQLTYYYQIEGVYLND